MDRAIKKNILDLHFQKYLTIISTSLVIAFTYLVGVFISFITKQIKFDDLGSMSVLFIFSVAVLGLCTFFFLKAYSHIKNIPNVLKGLEN